MKATLFVLFAAISICPASGWAVEAKWHDTSPGPAMGEMHANNVAHWQPEGFPSGLESASLLQQQFDTATRVVRSRGTRAGDDDGRVWEPVIYGPGFTREVMASVTWDDGNGESLYVGGQIMTAGPRQALGIARWDGEQWHPLGIGLNGPVRDMVVYDGELVVAGNFTLASNHDGEVVEVGNIARWDGESWHPVGSGFNGPSPELARVLALTVHEGDLIAGGAWFPDAEQTSSWIARWDGSQWQPFDTTFNQTVWDLVVYQGNLVAAGNFTEAGGEPVSRIAQWNGAAWEGLGGGTNLAVIRLAADGDQLIAGGVFSEAGGSFAGRIASWDGNAWSPVGSGLAGTDTPMVRSLQFIDGELYIGGAFTHAGGMPMNHIGRWDGSSWDWMDGPGEAGVGGLLNTVDTQQDGAVAAISPFQGDVVAAGMFYTAGGERSNYIARWNADDGWSPLPEPGSGLINVTDINNAPARALVQHGDDLIAGGGFDDLGHGVPGGSRLARWDGEQWSAIGGGIDDVMAAYGENVTGLASVDGQLYMGGSFESVSGVPGTQLIARWDGSQWQALRTGLSEAPQGALPNVESIVEYDDDVIAGGTFLNASGVSVSGIARWDGSDWAPLGQGVNGAVMAMVEHDGDLIAAGMFSQAGSTVVNGIARWDGSQWSALGSGMNDSVLALAVHNGELYAAGNFTQAGAAAANRIARWDGSQWHPLGGGVSGDVDGLTPRIWALAEFEGELYATGLFARADAGGETFVANSIARWDGSRWWPLSGPAGTGLQGEPSYPWAFSLDVYDAPGPTPPRLVVGGYHLLSGGVASWGLGFYGPPSLDLGVGELAFGAVEVGQTTAPQTVTLSSNHAQSIAVGSVDGVGGEVQIVGGSCGAAPFTLTSGGSCTMSLAFTPAVVGPYQGRLALDSDLPSSPHELSISGQGTNGPLGIWPQSIDFGDHATNATSNHHDVELTNASGSTLDITLIDGPGQPFTLDSGSCGNPPFQLPPQETCVVSIAYSPTAPGAAAETIEFQHDGSGGAGSLELTGTAHERALQVDTASVDFGVTPLGAHVTQVVEISNPGGIEATVMSWSEPGEPFWLDASGCGDAPRELAPGEACQMVLHFAPTVAGSSSDTLTIEGNVPTSPFQIAIAGQASGARLSVSPEEVVEQLGPDAAATQSLTLSNVGDASLAWQVTESPSSTGLLLRTTNESAEAHNTEPASDEIAGMARSPAVGDNVPQPPRAPTGGNGITLTHSASMQPVAGASIACGGGGATDDNRYLRVFDLDSFGLTEGFHVRAVTFGIETLNARVPLAVNLYSLSGELVYDNLTLLDSHSELVSPTQLELVEFPFDVALPPRTRLVVEIEADSFSGLAGFWPGANPHGQTSPSWWSSDGCNESEPVTLSEFGYPNTHVVMEVSGDAPFNCALPPWIESSVSGGNIAAGAAESVEVTLAADGLTQGSYRANLCLESNDGVSPVTATPVLLEVLLDDLFRDRFE